MTSQRYRIEVTEECISSGSCFGIAPGHFEEDDQGVTVPTQEVVDANPLVMDAAQCCPMGAIRLYDADTGAELF